MFCMELQYWLYSKVHYGLWANDTDNFRGYCLHRNFLRRSAMDRLYSSDYISDAVHGTHSS
jgi:hypothetical protein